MLIPKVIPFVSYSGIESEFDYFGIIPHETVSNLISSTDLI